jgi:hypothetical protein
VISRAATIARVDLIGLEEVEQPGARVDAPRPLPGSHEERAVLLGALAEARDNITLAAQQIGVSRVTLYRMLRRHGIIPSRGFKAGPRAAGSVGDARVAPARPVPPTARSTSASAG